MLESQDKPRCIKTELQAEADTLDEKIEKLDSFIYDPGTAYETTSVPHRVAMNQQLAAMRNYSIALKTRIRCF